MNKTILVIDDNLTVCLMLKSWLVKKGFNVDTVSHADEAKDMVREAPYDLILCDINMPDIDGFEFLNWVKKYDQDILVIMMTGYADIETAVESMKSGAVDYISKPIDPYKLFSKIEEAIQVHENTKKNSRLTNDYIIPPGKEYKQLFKQLKDIAENNTHSLIIGDRGTGKSSAVKYIYEKGIHLSKPLVLLDANDIIDKNNDLNVNYNGESIFSEKFQRAKGGLFYIRGIEQLNKFMQDDLLKIITRQNKDENFTQIVLSSEEKLENLKNILIPKLYRLIKDDCVILLSLKGREQQIIFFATYFLRFANFTLNKDIKRIDPVVQKQLVEYEWPGNIQELKNCIMKAALITDGDVIGADIADDLFSSGKIKNENGNQNINTNSIQSLRKENYEKEKICQALELAKGNKTLAASILNIDRKTLYNKIKLYKVKV